MTQTTPVPDAADFGVALGHALRKAREDRGLVRQQIEDATSLGRSTIQRIENGSRPADAVQLAKIVAAINDLDAPEFPVLSIREVVERAEMGMVRTQSRPMMDD